MSNEELALRIQQGERDKLGELWGQVEKFVSMRAGKMARHLGGFGGVTEEDLYQAGFLALVEAVETFDPGQAGFLTWLGYHLKTAFAQAAGYRSVKRDALDFAADLDAPLQEVDNLTLADAIEDPEAAQSFEEVERRAWLADSAARSSAMRPGGPAGPGSGRPLTAHYYQGKTFREIAAEHGRIRRTGPGKMSANKPFRTLRRNRHKNRLADFVEERTPYYLQRGGQPLQHHRKLRRGGDRPDPGAAQGMRSYGDLRRFQVKGVNIYPDPE